MGFGSALVDRARIVRQEATGARVAGSSVLAQVEGDWFRCRLEMPTGIESTAPSNGRRRGVTSPTLMYEEFNEVNDLVDLSSEDRVEVDSEELGRSLWEVVAVPQPIRKKRALLGHQVTVRRISTRELVRPAR